MSKTPDFFGAEQRARRRLARLNHLAGAFATSRTLPGNEEGYVDRLSLPSRAIHLVSDFLLQFEWPMPPDVIYRGVKTATRDEATPIEEADAQVILSAKVTTTSGCRREFDIPVVVRAGQLLEPSVAIVDGMPRVLAQSLIDELVRGGTFKQKIDPRGSIYGPPMDQFAFDTYLEQDDRLKERDRYNRGMYTVGSARRRGQFLYEPVQLVQPKGQFPAGTTGEVVDVDERAGTFSVVWDGFEDAGIQDYRVGDPAIDLASQHAARRHAQPVEAEDWWSKMSPAEQEAYIKEYPGTKKRPTKGPPGEGTEVKPSGPGPVELPAEEPEPRRRGNERLPPELREKLARLPPGKGRHVDLSKEELTHVLDDGTYALISAGRNPADPVDMALTDDQVAERHERLRQQLTRFGYAFTDAEGKYGGAPEDSFLVMVHDPDEADVIQLSHDMNQDSVLFASEGFNQAFYTTGEKAAQGLCGQGHGYEERETASDVYTRIKHPDGTATKFMLNVDFDHPVPCTRPEKLPVAASYTGVWLTSKPASAWRRYAGRLIGNVVVVGGRTGVVTRDLFDDGLHFEVQFAPVGERAFVRAADVARYPFEPGRYRCTRCRKTWSADALKRGEVEAWDGTIDTVALCPSCYSIDFAKAARQATQPRVDQVLKEVEELKEEGYDDVDAMLAVYDKYPSIAEAVIDAAKERNLLDV